MPFTSRKLAAFAVLPVLALGACAVAVPTGPTVVALPGQGKTFQQFQTDDYNCRGYAQSRTQYAAQEAQNASNSANGTAVVGTLIGAGLGAAIGAAAGNPGAGAAVGAGAGLLGGASVGGDQAQGAADSLQHRYNIAYAQCMVGNGEALQSAGGYGPPPGYYGGPPPGYYGGPPPGYDAPPPPPPGYGSPY